MRGLRYPAWMEEGPLGKVLPPNPSLTLTPTLTPTLTLTLTLALTLTLTLTVTLTLTLTQVLEGRLPHVVMPGERMGAVTAAAAARWGLRADCEVVGGTTDSIAAFLASGARGEGDAVRSLGSALAYYPTVLRARSPSHFLSLPSDLLSLPSHLLSWPSYAPGELAYISPISRLYLAR